MESPYELSRPLPSKPPIGSVTLRAVRRALKGFAGGGGFCKPWIWVVLSTRVPFRVPFLSKGAEKNWGPKEGP